MKKARKEKALAGYQLYRLAMLAVDGVPRIKRSKRQSYQMPKCFISIYIIKKLKLKLLADVTVLFQHLLQGWNSIKKKKNCLCKWWWIIKAKEDERQKKKEGVLEGCLLFSFLPFCLYSRGFIEVWWLWSKFFVFFMFWGIEWFRILEIFIIFCRTRSD